MIISINKNEMITKIKNTKTNKITFYKSGKQIFPVSISGNIALFKNGELVIF